MFGVLNLDKPQGVTSRDVVNSVQRVVRQTVWPLKLGHAGTLDPMATGVLLVCLGKATRLIPLLQASSKTYRAEFMFGQTSNTDDATGDVSTTDWSGGPISPEVLQTALQTFVGNIEQVPPQFSAVKVDGRRAYAKARQGESMQLRAKTVVIHSIDELDYAWPRLSLTITCGSGTYIRSIARDLGEQLGCGGLMSALQRTRIGQFDVKTAVAPEAVTSESITGLITNPVQIVAHLPQYRCTADDLPLLRDGKQVVMRETPAAIGRTDTASGASGADGSKISPGTEIALLSQDGQTLLALGRVQPEGTVQPRQVYCHT